MLTDPLPFERAGRSSILCAGVLARLTVVRMTDKICGTAIVFPALNIKRALPLKETLMLRARLAKTGYIAFACGMNI